MKGNREQTPTTRVSTFESDFEDVLELLAARLCGAVVRDRVCQARLRFAPPVSAESQESTSCDRHSGNEPISFPEVARIVLQQLLCCSHVSSSALRVFNEIRRTNQLDGLPKFHVERSWLISTMIETSFFSVSVTGSLRASVAEQPEKQGRN